MLDLIVSTMFAGLNIWGQPQTRLEPLKLFPWQDAAIFKLPVVKKDTVVENKVRDYLQKLNQSDLSLQGVWLPLHRLPLQELCRGRRSFHDLR